MKDYTVIDIETTGFDRHKHKIIELSALKIRDDMIVDEYDQLVDPECNVPKTVTDLTGITNKMLVGMPAINECLADFLKFLGNDVILGHNVSFDLGFITEACKRQGIDFECEKVDTLYLARKKLCALEHHKLSDLCERLDVINEHQHRALSDCKATYEVYKKLLVCEADEPIEKPKKSAARKIRRSSPETEALKEFIELLNTVLEDDVVEQSELNAVTFWLAVHKDLLGKYPFDVAAEAIVRVLKSDNISQSDLDELREIFENITEPTFFDEIGENFSLQGKKVCLTGDFSHGSRKDMTAFFENHGAIITNNVTRKTDLLLVGELGSLNWCAGNFGNKIKKAIELQQSGFNVKIHSEQEVFELIGDEVYAGTF